MHFVLSGDSSRKSAYDMAEQLYGGCLPTLSLRGADPWSGDELRMEGRRHAPSVFDVHKDRLVAGRRSDQDGNAPVGGGDQICLFKKIVALKFF